MELRLDEDALKEEIRKSTHYIARDIERIGGAKLTRDILDMACPHIQALLKMASSLPTKSGLRQFYDRETELAAKKQGARFQKKFGAEWNHQRREATPGHLLDQWRVSWTEDPNAEGFGAIIIVENDKMVKGRSSWFSLFELLWNGTNTYIAPVPMNPEEQTRLGKSEAAMNQHRERMKNEATVYGPGYFYKAKPISTKKRHVNLTDQRGRPRKVTGRRKTQEEMDKERVQALMSGERNAYIQTHKIEVERLSLEDVGSAKKASQTSYGHQRFVKGNLAWTHDVMGLGTTHHKEPAKRMHFYNRFTGRFYYNAIMRKGIESDVVQDFHEYVSDCVVKGIEFAIGQAFSMGIATEELANAIGKSKITRTA
jgi:hypothetical protein